MRRRILRINDLLRREISALLLHQVKDPRLATLVSVTEVQTTPDLRHARVFVSTLGSQEEQEAALAGLRSATKFLRHELAGRLELRQVPELAFYQDDSIERGARILALIREILPESAEEQGES